MSISSGPETSAKMAAQKFGMGSVLRIGGSLVNIADPIFTYSNLRKQGKSKNMAALQAAGQFAAWQVAAPVMWGKVAFDVATALGEAGTIIGRQNRDYVSRAFKSNFGGYYVDSHNAATMRQAGMQNISASRERVMSSIGGEAKSYYRRDQR